MEALSDSQVEVLRARFEKTFNGPLSLHPAYKDQYRNKLTQEAWVKYLCAALDELEEK